MIVFARIDMNFKKICASGAALLPMLAGAAGGGCSGSSGIGTAVHLYTGLGAEFSFFDVEADKIAYHGLDAEYTTLWQAYADRAVAQAAAAYGVTYTSPNVTTVVIMPMDAIQTYNMKRTLLGQAGRAILGVEFGLPVRCGFMGIVFVAAEANVSYGEARSRKASNPGHHHWGILQVTPLNYSFDVRFGTYITKNSAAYGILGTQNCGLHYKDIQRASVTKGQEKPGTRQLFTARTSVFYAGVGLQTSLDGVTFVRVEGRWAPKTSFTAKPSSNVGFTAEQFRTLNLQDSSCKIGFNSVTVSVITRF
jgi:hypothetical protein